VALPALVVVALVAVVAIASTGSTSAGTGRTRPPSQTLYDTLFSIGLVGVLLGGVLFVYGLMQRKAIAHEVASGRYRRTGVVAYLVFFAAFTAFSYWRLRSWTPPEPQAEEQETSFPPESPFPTLPEEAETSYTPTVSWIPMLVVIGLLLAGIVAYVLSERRGRRGRDALADRALALQLADVLDETLDDLRAEEDPRRAIIAAYARLERVLAANGIARRAAETSDEYLNRVLHLLELAPDAIASLTRLFTRSKFSQHDIDLAMKEEAISALEHVRDELRRTRAAVSVMPGEALAGAAS
jgi:hypothetical protein